MRTDNTNSTNTRKRAPREQVVYEYKPYNHNARDNKVRAEWKSRISALKRAMSMCPSSAEPYDPDCSPMLTPPPTPTR